MNFGLLKHLLRVSIIPVLIFVVIIYFYIFLWARLHIPDNWIGFFKNLLFTVFAFTIAFWLQRISGAVITWYARNIADRTKVVWDEEFIPLFRKTTKIAIWVIAIIIVLAKFGVNVNALIATLGVSSLAIALAAQDTIANIIAGFLIMIDRPFRIGDEIKLPSGEMVKVLDIGIRRSKFLKLDDNAIVIVPNLDLSKSKIINYSYTKEQKTS
jgi:MscS family membrane protein